MTIDDSISKTVGVPLFTGEPDKYQMWWLRFLAFTTVKKFKKALKVGGKDDFPPKQDSVIDTSNETGKKQQAALDQNEMAVACFTIAFTKDDMMSLVVSLMTLDWPEGKAGEIGRLLAVNFKPKDFSQSVSSGPGC